MESLVNAYGVLLLASLRVAAIGLALSAAAGCTKPCDNESWSIDLPLVGTDHTAECPAFPRLTLEVLDPCGSPLIAVDGELVEQWSCERVGNKVSCEYAVNNELVVATMVVTPERAVATIGSSCHYSFGEP